MNKTLYKIIQFFLNNLDHFIEWTGIRDVSIKNQKRRQKRFEKNKHSIFAAIF